MKYGWLCAMLAAVALQPSEGLAQTIAASSSTAPSPSVPRRAITHHTVQFNGQSVRYQTVVEDNFVADKTGRPGASIVTIAYLREDVGDTASRPVLFAFNGGPGAASAQLNTKALGPLIRPDTATASTMADRAAPEELVANPSSILDAVDLVFVDPVGTGVSRAFPGVDPKYWYDGDNDARSVEAAIANWLKVHGREKSPRFVMGESYGTVRAGMMMRDWQTLRFDGVMLVALVGQTPGPDLPFITALPTMAAGRWYHDTSSRAGHGVEQTFDDALEFARADYAVALLRGSTLPDADRRRIVARLSHLTGMPSAVVEANGLRIPRNVWMFNLLEAQGLRTGLLDVRVTAPLPSNRDEDGALDDPALNVVPSGAKKDGKPFNPADVGPVPNASFGRHLVRDLGFPTSDTYFGINFSANAAWHQDWDANAVVPIAAAMRADPKLRLFWTAGLYDLTTPAYAARYTLDQAGIPAERLTAQLFAGPHGVYEGAANRALFARAVRAFILAPR